MTEELQQTIKEEIAKLPKENQAAINSLDWAKITEEIGKKNLLLENEINDLQAETLVVLVGLEDSDFYATNIENNIGTSKDEANKITEEVFQKIFTPINNILIENIKKSGKARNANAEQNLNFILSGGDYSAFMDVPPPLDKGRIEEGSFNSDPLPTSPLVRGSENNTLKMDPVRSREGSQRPSTSNGMDDIKNKFTI